MPLLKILLLGGTGALASARIHSRIVEFVAESGVVSDDEFPEILHHSVSVPDEGFTGNFDIDMVTTSKLCEVFVPDLIAVCCLSVSDKVRSLESIAPVLTPLDVVRQRTAKGATILTSRYASEYLTVPGCELTPGVGIAELARGIDALRIISEQLDTVEHPVFGCTEYVLVAERFPQIPNVGTMLIEEVVRCAESATKRTA